MEKLPPHSIEAEEAVLGSILIDGGDSIIRIGNELRPGDFYREKNKWVYEVMLDLHNAHEPIDFLTICDELTVRGQLDVVGGPAFITGLINASPTSVHAEHYAALVAEKAVRRRLIRVSGRIAATAYDESQEIGEVLAKSEQAIFQVKPAFRTERTMTEILDDIDSNIEKPKKRLDSRIFVGMQCIDAGLFGIESGRYWVVGAVSGTGKSVFGINIMRNLPSGSGCLYLTPEQDPTEITTMAYASGTKDMSPLRIKLLGTAPTLRAGYAKNIMTADQQLAQQIYGSGVSFEDLTRERTASERAQLAIAKNALTHLNIWPITPGDLDIYGLRRLMRRKRAELNYVSGDDAFLFVVVDGLGLIKKTSASDKLSSLMEISQQLKVAAMEDIQPGAILANHHLNRTVFGNGHGQRVYSFSHLRDAPVENDADVIIFLDRQSVWDDKPLQGVWELVKVHCAKNRQTARTFASSTYLNVKTLRMEDGHA